MESSLFIVAQVGFMLVAVVYLSLLIVAFRHALGATDWSARRRKRFLTITVSTLIVWALFVSIWSLSGIMADFTIFPLNIAPVIAIPLIGAFFFLRTDALGQVLMHIPPERILWLQSFRFFVEFLLWALYLAALLPVQMTFEGLNFDILVGLTGPIVALLVARGRWSPGGIVAWNIVGLLLLANIVTIAILSAPSPIRVFMNEPANVAVTWFPISWLPGLLVPLAYYLHFMSIRQILALQRSHAKTA